MGVHIFKSLSRRTHLRPFGGTTVGLNALGSLVHVFDSQRFQQLFLLTSLSLQSRLIQEYLHFLVVSGQSPLLHLFDFFEMLNTLLWVIMHLFGGGKVLSHVPGSSFCPVPIYLKKINEKKKKKMLHSYNYLRASSRPLYI